MAGIKNKTSNGIKRFCIESRTKSGKKYAYKKHIKRVECLDGFMRGCPIIM